MWLFSPNNYIQLDNNIVHYVMSRKKATLVAFVAMQ